MTYRQLLQFIASNENINLDMPIYLGNDEELNGIHEAMYIQEVQKDEFDGIYGSEKIKDNYILIS